MAYPVFDLHCDTADRLAWQFLDPEFKEVTQQDFYGPGDDRSPQDCCELARSHNHISLEKVDGTPWAQCFACYIPDALPPQMCEAFYRQVSDLLDGQVAKNADRVAFADTAAGIRPLLDAGKTVAVRTIENARLFAADPGLVETLAAQGLLMASLSWNAQGPLASGHDVEDAGITALGAEVIERMDAAGVVLDVSHLNDTCFADVVRLTDRPFVASHSNSRAVWDHKRNLTDAQAAEIRDRGGLIGLNFTRYFIGPDDPDFDVFSRHVEHLLDMGCEGVLALGSDFDGTTTPSFIADSSLMPAFQRSMAERFGEDVARRVCAENALAFFEANCR